MELETLAKDLSSLIDETLQELSELKKSNKFSAAEIKIEGPGTDLANKPTNGELDAKKAEDKKDDEDDKEEDEKEVEKSCEVEKADKEDKEDKEEEKKDKKEDKKIAQKEVDKHNEKKHGEAKDADSAFKSESEVAVGQEELKKSIEAQEQLLKTYVDSKFDTMEKRISELTASIAKLADMPVNNRSIPTGIRVLAKSDEKNTLTKSEVLDKLWELKKSGKSVDTADIIRVEVGSANDALDITKKYGI